MTSVSPVVSWRAFNPTRVRLEQRDHVQGESAHFLSIPRGYVWNVQRDFSSLIAWVLSIPRGYVWNERMMPAKRRPLVFQSHEGTSGTRLRGRCTVLACSFNPTRVRLELSKQGKRYENEIVFQSHEGTSGTTPRRRSSCLPKNFQSHEGTSGTSLEETYHLCKYDLSIPRGYVWNARVGDRAQG